MRFCLSLTAMMAVHAVSAFQPIVFSRNALGQSSRTAVLQANSENIRAAMEASERYGSTSPEARLAWETVEELDANANSFNAYQGNEEYRLSDEQFVQACREAQAFMELVLQRRGRTQNLLSNNNEQFMKDVVAELQAIKLAPPEKQPAPQIPGLWDAKLKARAITQQYGVDSSEARLAWEEVEEIASAGLETAMGQQQQDPMSQQQRLGQAAEAYMALEELNRFLHYEHDKMMHQDSQLQYQQQQGDNSKKYYLQADYNAQYYHQPDYNTQYYQQPDHNRQYYQQDENQPYYQQQSYPQY